MKKNKVKNEILREYETRYQKNGVTQHITYFIDKVNRVVACTIELHTEAFDMFDSDPSQSLVANGFMDTIFERSNEDVIFRAKAVCSEEDKDKFNVEFGKRLAYHKAELKVSKKREAFMRIIYENMRKDLMTLGDYVASAASYRMVKEQKLKDIDDGYDNIIKKYVS